MTERPFHHGNLRAVLLAEAERTLSEQGADALSLRELARQAGVSHAAPRRHFPDRQALLHALAVRGFDRLTDEMRNAPGGGFRAVAQAYVRFAIDDAALLELMFASKGAAPPELQEAADRFFTYVGGVMQQVYEAGEPVLDNPYRLQMLLVATLQGIATLVGAGRLPAAQIDDLISDAEALFTQRVDDRQTPV